MPPRAILPFYLLQSLSNYHHSPLPFTHGPTLKCSRLVLSDPFNMERPYTPLFSPRPHRAPWVSSLESAPPDSSPL